MHNFKFLGFEVDELEYHIVKGRLSDDNFDNLNIGYGIAKADDKQNVFKLILGATVEHSFNEKKEKSLKIDTKISGFFEFEDRNINQDDAEEVLKINGSAILFPYIRTLIQFVSSYDNKSERIMMPPINIAAIISDIDEQYKQEK